MIYMGIAQEVLKEGLIKLVYITNSMRNLHNTVKDNLLSSLLPS